MARALASKSPREPKALEPQTRMTMIFRELEIDKKKSWRFCWVFAQHAADDGDDEMVAVMDCFKKLKKREQANATPEFVCDLAGVSPNAFAGAVFQSYVAYSEQAANLVAAAGLPGVVRKSVEVAQTSKGVADRKFQFEHSGFLPTKQGGGIHVNATANAETKTATIVQAPELPSMESDSLRFTRLLKDSTTITAQPAIEPAAPVKSLGGGQ